MHIASGFPAISCPCLLADPCGVRGSPPLSYTAGSTNSLQVGVHCEILKIPLGADSDAHLPGSKTGPCERSGVPYGGESSQSSRVRAHAQSAPALAWLKVLGQYGGSGTLLQTVADEGHPDPLLSALQAKPPTDQHTGSDVRLIVHQELQWWSRRPNLLAGVVFPRPETNHVVTTDASLTGWSGYLLDQEAASL